MASTNRNGRLVRTKKTKRKPLSEKQKASDEKLRESLRNFDLKVFDRALEKALSGPSK